MPSPSIEDCAVSKHLVQFYVCREAIITFPMFDLKTKGLIFSVHDALKVGLLNLTTGEERHSARFSLMRGIIPEALYQVQEECILFSTLLRYAGIIQDGRNCEAG